MAGSVAVAAHNNAEALAQLRRAGEQGVDLVKLMITGGVLDATQKGTPGELKMKPEMVRAVCDEAHRLGYPVAAHTESPEGVKVALENGVDSIEHGFFMDDWCFDFMKEHNVFFVPTLAAPYWIKKYGTDAGIPDYMVKKVEKIEDDVTIDWSPAEPTALYTMVHYTDNSGKVQELKIENSEEETVLKDYKSMTKFDVQTYFLPDEMSIDTFKTAVVSYGVSEDITDLYLKNYKRPFEGRDKNADNKWGILVDWDFTPNILNQSNGKGGWSDDWGNQSIHLESKDWSGDGITNGKVYQSFELPAGNYQLECELEGGSNGMNGYLAASRGSVLPDIDRLKEEALGYSQYGDSNMGGKHTLTFSLAEPATVSVGWVVTFGSSTWMKVLYIKLMNIADTAE
mgnify:CR=1 FL=1